MGHRLNWLVREERQKWQDLRSQFDYSIVPTAMLHTSSFLIVFLYLPIVLCVLLSTCITPVAVPVKDVYVVQLTPDGEESRVEEHSEMNEVLLVQHDQQGIGCVTSLEGSFLVPSLNVTFGDRDVTDLFQLSTERTPILMESGLTLFYVTVRRTFVTSQPDPYISGQAMTCIAAVQYGNTVATSSASAVVIVHCK